ncbi:MFS transporter, partial [Klebsiella aerogenes]|nr:MFS transporter [Klebsiella aerogenes]
MTSKSELKQFTATKATPDALPQHVAEKRTLALGGLGWAFESYDSFLLSLLLPVLGMVFGVNKS